MWQTNTAERKLYSAIVEFQETVDRMYAPQLLDEEESLGRKLQGIRKAKWMTDLLSIMTMLDSREGNLPEEYLADMVQKLEAWTEKAKQSCRPDGQRTPQ